MPLPLCDQHDYDFGESCTERATRRVTRLDRGLCLTMTRNYCPAHAQQHLAETIRSEKLKEK